MCQRDTFGETSGEVGLACNEFFSNSRDGKVKERGGILYG